MSLEENYPEKITFQMGKRNNFTAINELINVTGIDEIKLIELIPELKRSDLAFNLRWADEYFEDAPDLSINKPSLKEFIILNIPGTNVDDSVKTDLNGCKLSYVINYQTCEISGYNDFYAADEFLLAFSTSLRP